MPDEGWVRIYHPDHLADPEHLPDPDDPEGVDHNMIASVTEEAFQLAWERRGWRNLDADRAGAVAEDMPEKAADRIAWIDEGDTLEDQKARAQLAYDDETSRDDGGRSTVINHAEDILTSEEDQTSTTDSEQES